MKIKLILFPIVILLTNISKGYDKPNSIAFDSKSKSYYISNNKGKTITRLDSNFNKKEIITGLTSPKDLIFSVFGPYKGLLILDSNAVKVYDADSFKLIASFDVNGAIDLEDCEIDKTKSNIFYMSDSKAHKIFKVEVGGAPFYIPTFSTLCNFRNAKALLFDSKNRLLCTSDTTNSQVYIVNTSNGYKSLLQTTTIDYINSIVEDLEGNFYATSWGDSYVYRLGKDFKNAKSLIGYSKPTGLIFNKMYDVLGIACSNCNKVEFYKLHMIYIDYADTAKCPGDSFYVNTNIMYKGIGTYNQSNSFIVELSDGNGKFTSPVKTGEIVTTSEPNSYKISLPEKFRFYGTSYKLRIKSTNPVFYSLNEIDVVIPYVPSSDFFDKDTINYCSSNTVSLGKKIISADTQLCNYKLYKNGKIIQENKTTYQYSGTGNHKFLLSAIPKTGGCIAKDSVTLIEYIKIEIPFNDTLQVCRKSDAIIGGDSIANTTITWIDKTTSQDYGKHFKFTEYWKTGNSNKIFTAKVKSTIAECTAEKDIYLFYKNIPHYSLEDTIYKVCTANSIFINPVYVDGDTQNIRFYWSPQQNLNDAYKKSTTFKFNTNKDTNFVYKLIFTDTFTQCKDSLSCKISNFEIPDKPLLKQIDNYSVRVLNFNNKYNYNFEIIKINKAAYNGNLNDTFIQISQPDSTDMIIVKVSNNMMCYNTSDTFNFKRPTEISILKKLPFSVFPNPSNNFINIKSEYFSKSKLLVKINDYTGRNILDTEFYTSRIIDISELKIGYYFLNITFENKTYNFVFIKN
ncbi:MAG: T9SS type A sorting domain-containing protein [Bacteroidetes bacterium]|nr:T9SS type A sorting domain-containing protein [Bacteroidota bacterium]